MGRVKNEELESLEQTGTKEVADRSQNARVEPCKGVLELKRNANGKEFKYNARLGICPNVNDADPSCTLESVMDWIVVRLMQAIAA